MNCSVRAKPSLTPMRRGLLPKSCCRHPTVDGLERSSGRNASPSGITPSNIMSPARNQPEPRTEVSPGARAHNTRPSQRAHAPPRPTARRDAFDSGLTAGRGQVSRPPRARATAPARRQTLVARQRWARGAKVSALVSAQSDTVVSSAEKPVEAQEQVCAPQNAVAGSAAETRTGVRARVQGARDRLTSHS
jgi:hypothetical protein